LTDQKMDRLEQWIGVLLRAGVVLAAAVALSGGVWHVAQASAGAPDLRVFRGESAELRSALGVLRGIGAGHSAALIQLGLLLLIATPVARVALAAVAFAMQRDRTYVVISLIVLAVLAASLAGINS
jgi:uncharacterized membrane protein